MGICPWFRTYFTFAGRNIVCKDCGRALAAVEHLYGVAKGVLTMQMTDLFDEGDVQFNRALGFFFDRSLASFITKWRGKDWGNSDIKVDRRGDSDINGDLEWVYGEIAYFHGILSPALGKGLAE